MMKATSLAILLVLLAEAAFADEHTTGGDLAYQTFAGMPYLERELRILDLPLADQVSAYLVMIDESEPPDLLLATRIARGGWPLARLAMERIARDRTDWVRARLLLLLSEVQIGGYADLRTDAQLMETLETVVQEISSPTWRESSERKLVFIKQGGYQPRLPNP